MAQILIIKDNIELRNVLKEMLERKNYDVLTAANGKEGLDLAFKESIDLVIADIIMPEVDGIDVIYELKKKYPSRKVTAISGGGKESAEDHLETTKLLSNVKYTFKKPFSNEELLQAVKELIG